MDHKVESKLRDESKFGLSRFLICVVDLFLRVLKVTESGLALFGLRTQSARRLDLGIPG